MNSALKKDYEGLRDENKMLRAANENLQERLAGRQKKLSRAQLVAMTDHMKAQAEGKAPLDSIAPNPTMKQWARATVSTYGELLSGYHAAKRSLGEHAAREAVESGAPSNEGASATTPVCAEPESPEAATSTRARTPTPSNAPSGRPATPGKNIAFPGLLPGELPPASPPAAAAGHDASAIFAHFSSLSGDAKRDYYVAHKAVLGQPAPAAALVQLAQAGQARGEKRQHMRAEVRERLARLEKPRAEWSDKDKVEAQIDMMADGPERTAFIRANRHILADV
jgi:hypothetical protein